MPLQLLIEYPADGGAPAAVQHAPRTRTTRFRVIEHAASATNDAEAARSDSVVGACSWIMIARVLLAHAIAFYCFYTFAHFSSLSALFSFPSLLWPHLPCLLALLLSWRLIGLRSRRGSATLQHLREESILVIPGVGVQLESGTAAFDPTAAAAIAATRNGSNGSRSLSADRSTLAATASSFASSTAFPSVRRRARRFLDASSIAHVLINEGVHRSTFVYYLVFVMKGAAAAAVTAEGATGAAKTNGTIAASAAAASSSVSCASSSSGLAAPSDLIHADQTLVLPFEQLAPRYNILLPIYEGMQACLAATSAQSN